MGEFFGDKTGQFHIQDRRFSNIDIKQQIDVMDVDMEVSCCCSTVCSLQ